MTQADRMMDSMRIPSIPWDVILLSDSDPRVALAECPPDSSRGKEYEVACGTSNWAGRLEMPHSMHHCRRVTSGLGKQHPHTHE